MMKKLFNKYPKIIAYLLPLPWWIVATPLLFSISEVCSHTIPTVLLSTFTLFIIPNWIGIFISIKKLHYVIGGFIYGSWFTIGLVAYVGMNCGGI